jgi:secreted trypsin-like serine protease
MANISAYAEKAMLDYINTGATATLPAAWALALGTAAPTSVSTVATWEVGTASGYSCQTMKMPAASSPAGSCTNTVAATFGPFSSACTISGMMIKDASATAGNSLWYGTLATARTLGVGDSLVFAVGSLTITLA